MLYKCYECICSQCFHAALHYGSLEIGHYKRLQALWTPLENRYKEPTCRPQHHVYADAKEYLCTLGQSPHTVADVPCRNLSCQSVLSTVPYT